MAIEVDEHNWDKFMPDYKKYSTKGAQTQKW